MKALTLHRPWSWAIVHGTKRIENRDWKPTAYLIGQRLLIHGGKTFDTDGAEFVGQQMGLHPDGTPPKGWLDQGIVGVCKVLGFTKLNPAGTLWCSTFEARRALAGQRAWFFGTYGWVLGDVVAFTEPVPCRGAQGLWTPDAEVLRQVELRRAA